LGGLTGSPASSSSSQSPPPLQFAPSSPPTTPPTLSPFLDSPPAVRRRLRSQDGSHPYSRAKRVLAISKAPEDRNPFFRTLCELIEDGYFSPEQVALYHKHRQSVESEVSKRYKAMTKTKPAFTDSVSQNGTFISYLYPADQFIPIMFWAFDVMRGQ
jgi:hypothetical protein